MELHGLSVVILTFMAWVAVWIGLFYTASCTTHIWLRGVQPSRKEHENDKYWLARCFVGIIHAALVAVVSVPVMFRLLPQGVDTQYAVSRHLDTCALPQDVGIPAGDWLGEGYEVMAVIGTAFTAFMVSDIIVSTMHGLATLDYAVHHLAFLTCGLIIRGYCMLPLNAAILLSMEISTPSLNWLLMFRNRGPEWDLPVKANGVVFFFTYLIFRIGINTYGAVLLWQHRNDGIPAFVPIWQKWFLVLGVLAGAAVQFFWLPGIVRIFGVAIWTAFTGSSQHEDQDENESRELLEVNEKGLEMEKAERLPPRELHLLSRTS